MKKYSNFTPFENFPVKLFYFITLSFRKANELSKKTEEDKKVKLKTLGELLAVATETEAALKDHEKEKGGRRSDI